MVSLLKTPTRRANDPSRCCAFDLDEKSSVVDEHLFVKDKKHANLMVFLLGLPLSQSHWAGLCLANVQTHDYFSLHLSIMETLSFQSSLEKPMRLGPKSSLQADNKNFQRRSCGSEKEGRRQIRKKILTGARMKHPAVEVWGSNASFDPHPSLLATFWEPFRSLFASWMLWYCTQWEEKWRERGWIRWLISKTNPQLQLRQTQLPVAAFPARNKHPVTDKHPTRRLPRPVGMAAAAIRSARPRPWTPCDSVAFWAFWGANLEASKT